MDGKNLLRLVRQLLGETSTGTFLDERTTYDYLYEAAKEWVRETACLTAEQSITTVAEIQGYTLDGEFMGLYLKHNDEYIIKIYDGSDYYFAKFKPYGDVYYENDTTSVAIPPYFTIRDDRTLDTMISDTADNDGGNAVGGKATLTMDTAVFTDVTPGDIIHNTTDASDGIITKTESTFKILEICLFGGTDNEIDASDAFIIQPRKRMEILLVPPPSTASYTIYVPYIRKPRPVYSDYDTYMIPMDHPEVLAKYAAWLYKYRDSEPDFGDAWYKYWDYQLTQHKRMYSRSLNAERAGIQPKWAR